MNRDHTKVQPFHASPLKLEDESKARLKQQPVTERSARYNEESTNTQSGAVRRGALLLKRRLEETKTEEHHRISGAEHRQLHASRRCLRRRNLHRHRPRRDHRCVRKSGTSRHFLKGLRPGPKRETPRRQTYGDNRLSTPAKGQIRDRPCCLILTREGAIDWSRSEPVSGRAPQARHINCRA
ncbi:hypothetical protein Bca52824_026163 [Brassica carinata]|uniref:Uncharacterized protein n=1 Tax=Brassica carinata TaxID=52824 RepID=A0A8X7SJ84_BRACI|nr:hypothetical protein Bca52824_026163 [Brassica carinata]